MAAPTDDDMLRLYNDIMADVSGVIPDSIRSAMYRAYDEFLDFTNVFQVDVDITLAANDTTYTLAAPAQGRYNRLLVLFDPQQTNPLSLDWADNARFDPPNTITIATVPNTSGTVWTAKMAMRCPVTAIDGYPDIPGVITAQYREALYNGVRKYLHLIPSRPWTSTEMAKFHGQQFQNLKAQARIQTIKGNVAGQTNWAFPRGPFTRGSQRW